MLECIKPKSINFENNNSKLKTERKIICLRPLHNKSVKTNMVRISLNLVEEHCAKEHKLHKDFKKIS